MTLLETEVIRGIIHCSQVARGLTVDLPKHGKHVLQVAVVQKPYLLVSVIFLEGHCSMLKRLSN